MTDHTKDALVLAAAFAVTMAAIAGFVFLIQASPAAGQIHYGPGAKPPMGVVQPPPLPNPRVRLPGEGYPPGGIPIYDASECIGAVVAGVCHGSVIDTDPMRPRCHGVLMPDGTCTGPVF